MRLRECLTLDLEARGEPALSLRALVLRMLLERDCGMTALEIR